MATGNHYAGARFQLVSGVIKNRRGHLPDAGDLHTAVNEPLAECAFYAGARQPSVAPYNRSLLVFGKGLGRKCSADPVADLLG